MLLSGTPDPREEFLPAKAEANGKRDASSTARSQRRTLPRPSRLRQSRGREGSAVRAWTHPFGRRATAVAIAVSLVAALASAPAASAAGDAPHLLFAGELVG